MTRSEKPVRTQDSGWEELGGREAAEKHIQEIRTSRGLGGKSVPPELVEILEQSCKILANQLYEGPTHFLLELIQNANDNKYIENNPTVIFTYTPGNIQVQCNEVGFNRDNVTAICSLGSSSKKSKKRPDASKKQDDDSIVYVGEKGIGFKSVFRVADVVWVSSRAYNFKFDSGAPLGMITPTVEKFPVSKLKNWTSLYLRLKEDRDGTSIEPKIRAELENFDGRLLLFLHSLRTIKIQIFDDFGGMTSFQYDKDKSTWDGDETIRLRNGKTVTSFLIHRQKITSLPSEERREGVSSSEIVLGFPVNQSKEPIIVPQRVFAFLPIQDFGFSVILQADFLLTANREGVESSNPWNETLRDGFIHAFGEAAKHFNETSLQYTWIRYLPETSNSKGFFEVMKRGIRDAMVVLPVLRAWNETPLRPDKAVIVPAKFRDEDGRPLTLTSDKQQYYLSRNYKDADFKYLKYLGIKEMTYDDFLTDLGQLLESHFADFTNQTNEWHVRLAGVLTNLLMHRPVECLEGLPLVKLRTGRWISLAPEGEKAFFPGENDRKVPGGIELQIVDPESAQDPTRRQLYSKLGVTEIDNSVVQETIVELHQSWTTQPNILSFDLIAQAQFLFSTQWVNSDEDSIWIVTERGRFVKGSEAYIDCDEPLAASKVFRENRTGFNFLHPRYLSAHADNQEGWTQWFVRNVGVSKIPRLVMEDSPYKLSKDFKFIVNSLPSEQWLQILCEHWTEYEGWLKSDEPGPDDEIIGEPKKARPTDEERLVSELHDTEVICRDKRRYRLHETYLPLDGFVSAASGKGPLLRIKDPEDVRWQNLAIFGVGVKNNYEFYLYWLDILAASSTSVKRSEVDNLLRQIQARCSKEDESLVKNFFLNSTRRLIFVPDPKPPPTNLPIDKIFATQPQQNTQGHHKLSATFLAEIARIQDAERYADYATDDGKAQKGKWYPAAQFLWCGPRYFRVNRSINTLYTGNERLFRDILGLDKVDISHFVAEARSFKLEDDSVPSPLEYMWQILAALDSFMSDYWNYTYRYSYSHLHAYYAEFRALKMFPISKNPDEPPTEMRTAASSDEWFIADRWDLQEVFWQVVPLLAFTPDQLFGLKTVVRNLSLEDRYLSKVSQCTTKFEGRNKLSPQYSERFHTKSPFLIRIVNSEAGLANSWRIACLENIQVFIVDKIVKRNTVRYENQVVEGESRESDAYAERDGNKLNIYVVSSYLESDKTLDELTTSIVSALEIPDREWLRLFQFVLGNDNEEKISKFLDKENIPRNPNAKEDYDWGTSEDTTRYSGSGGGSARSENYFRVISSDNFHEFSSSFPMAGRNGVWFMAADENNDASAISEQLAKLGFQVMLPNSRPQQSGWDAPEEEVDEALQFLGEQELSQRLQEYLGSLYVPEKHWTSVHRTQAGLPAFEPQDGKAGAAFTIPDDPNHRFVKLLAQQYGRNASGIWAKPPKYFHLEVVPSYGELSAEFSLTSEQFERIRKLSYQRKGSGLAMPTQASVLVRVYDVGQNPRFAFLVEPWKLYMEDKIEFRCQGNVTGQPVNTEGSS